MDYLPVFPLPAEGEDLGDSDKDKFDYYVLKLGAIIVTLLNLKNYTYLNFGFNLHHSHLSIDLCKVPIYTQ